MTSSAYAISNLEVRNRPADEPLARPAFANAPLETLTDPESSEAKSAALSPYPFILASRPHSADANELPGTESTEPVDPTAGLGLAPIRLPAVPVSPSRTQLVQQWEGVVTEVRDADFDVLLHDLTDRSRARESATIPLEEVSDCDKRLVQPGGVFYWSIGYELRAGSKRRFSDIRFRRLPAWTQADIAAVQRETDELLPFLNDDAG